VLIGCRLLLLRDFGLYVIFMNVCFVITLGMVWCSFAVKRFLAVWDSIVTVAMVKLLKEALNFCILLFGNSALKQKTVHLSMACCVHMYIHTVQ
jgi:hypothetical protein